MQFTAVPWMRDHLSPRSAARRHLKPDSRSATTPPAASVEAIKGDGEPARHHGSPEQKEIIDRLTGVMSLLEGHADVVMDGVGPSVIPTVAKIRKQLHERRKGAGVLDQMLRRLLGLDTKMGQYRDGAAFVRAVVDAVGMDGFNAVWATPTTCRQGRDPRPRRSG